MMTRRFFVLCLGFLTVTAFWVRGSSVYIAHAETDAERKVRLQQELQNVEQQIKEQQVLVDTTQQQRKTLERDVSLLDAQIKKAKLGIQARTIAIQQLDDQITDKEGVIDELSTRLGKEQQSLGQLIRKIQEVDDYSLPEILLGNDHFSSFFDDLESFQTIKSSLHDSLALLKQIRSETEDQKQTLETKQLSEAKLKDLQEQEKSNIEQNQTQKNKILKVTKGQEKEYQALLESQQKTAAQIRAQLFALSGGGAAIPFPQAVDLAEFASKQSGVPTALILAILEQESSYGSDIGNCNYDQMVQGKPVMHPDRDQPVFLALASVAGYDPKTQVVSCPWIRKGTRVGWGGAMGPSQFIPSTWAIYGGMVNSGSGWVYDKGSDKIRSLTGKSSPSNPFNNLDAFMATALLIRDNGGAGDSYKAGWTAAVRYFAGWGGPSNPINYPYGDNVMIRKERLEGEIKILRGS